MFYNFWQWMSWFPKRWRTQRNAIHSVKRVTSWSSRFWTHISPPGASWWHAQLSDHLSTSVSWLEYDSANPPVSSVQVKCAWLTIKAINRVGKNDNIPLLPLSHERWGLMSHWRKLPQRMSKHPLGRSDTVYLILNLGKTTPWI